MKQTGLFDWQTRFEQLDNGGDPLAKLNEVVNWELFRQNLEKACNTDRKYPAGRKPFDAVLMFKILILQSLYNLSDDQLEFQIRDRLSFMRFLGLSLEDTPVQSVGESISATVASEVQKCPAGPCINGPGARLAVPKNQKFGILRSKIYSKYVNETFEPYKSNY